MLNRKWPEILTVCFYVVILLSFPFLWIVNGLLFNISDGKFLFGVVLIWLVLALWARQTQVDKSKTCQINFLRQDFWPNALLMLWFFHAVTLFLRFNYVTDRKPFADESTLWFVAAARMVTDGFFVAHTSGYPGRGIQPLGISFIAALPEKVFNLGHHEGIFFMPLVVVIIIGMFLYAIRRDHLFFLYFLTATFVTFHNYSWMSELCYRLVYGEGLSMAIFLAVSWQLWMIKERNECLNRGSFLSHLGGKPMDGRVVSIEKSGLRSDIFLILCLLLGLLVLVKWPLAVIIYFFFVVLVVQYLNSQIDSHIKKFLVVLIAGGLLVVPQLLWNVFNRNHGFSVPGLMISYHDLFQRLGEPNIAVLKLIIADIYHQYDNFFYQFLLSMGLIIWGLKEKEFLHTIPVVAIVSLVLFYYAYIFIYPDVEGDWASALRYMMPCILAVYFYGAIAYERLVRKYEPVKGAVWGWIVYLGFMAVPLVKMF